MPRVHGVRERRHQPFWDGLLRRNDDRSAIVRLFGGQPAPLQHLEELRERGRCRPAAPPQRPDAAQKPRKRRRRPWESLERRLTAAPMGLSVLEPDEPWPKLPDPDGWVGECAERGRSQGPRPQPDGRPGRGDDRLPDPL